MEEIRFVVFFQWEDNLCRWLSNRHRTSFFTSPLAAIKVCSSPMIFFLKLAKQSDSIISVQ
jgi:hypothetical protein